MEIRHMVRKGHRSCRRTGTSEGWLLLPFTRDHCWNQSEAILYPRAPNASRKLWKSLSQVRQARGMCSNVTRFPPWMDASAMILQHIQVLASLCLIAH